jgi:beta-ureidopropionase / N-carbamoyl-L-amino-acid hydrolase
MSATAVTINRTRFERTLRGLAVIGADPRGGVSRLGLSAAEDEARTYLSSVSRAAGLVPEIDPAGNLLIQSPARRHGRPIMMIGSHTDTVVQGGWLDGSYGVVAALEVLAVLAETGADCAADLVAAGFANEEGALVQYPFWGSRALAGNLIEATSACDRDGRPVTSYLRELGCDPGRLDDAAWPAGSISAYLELHIEQGCVLEDRRIPIGIVQAIVGRTVFDIEVCGQPGHPGTTPMASRKDALTAASELVLGVERMARTMDVCSTATVGFLEASPNTTNTIPGAVRLSAEIRDSNRARLMAGEQRILEMASGISGSRGLEIIVRVAHRVDPVPAHPAIRSTISTATRRLGLDHLMMPSGAGHDAQIIAKIAPVGMIFVPSKGGVSHTPQEDTDMHHLVAGANVLLHTVTELSQGTSLIHP